MLFGTKLLVGQYDDDGIMLYAKVVDIDSDSKFNFMIESKYSVRFALNGFDPDHHIFDVTPVKDSDDGSSSNVRAFDFDESDNVDPLKLKFEVKPWIRTAKYPLRDGRECIFSGMHLVINDRSSTRLHRMNKFHSITFVYELPASKRDIRAAIDLLTAVKPGPALPKVLAELIVSYLGGCRPL